MMAKKENKIVSRIGQEMDLMAELEALDDDLFEEAERTNWVTDGISKLEQKQISDKRLIAFEICAKRHDMGMNQKEFAKYMNVSQVMVSKWESGDYNFTLDTLNEICYKLRIDFKPSISSNKISNKRCKVTPIYPNNKRFDEPAGYRKVVIG